MEIKSGDCVVLKSGGPTMVVRWIEENVAFCEWFIGEEPKGKSFAVISIKLAKDE